MKKKFLAVLLAVAMVLGVTACGSSKDSSKSTTEAVKKEETTTITLAAAASLEKCYTEKLIPMFEKENKGIKVEGSYDSSGKLQTRFQACRILLLFVMPSSNKAFKPTAFAI